MAGSRYARRSYGAYRRGCDEKDEESQRCRRCLRAAVLVPARADEGRQVGDLRMLQVAPFALFGLNELRASRRAAKIAPSEA